MHMALCAERNEHRKRAEVVDMMVNGAYAERAEVGYYHRAVERAYIQKLLRQQTEIVCNAQKPDGKADDEARQGSKLVCKFLGAVFLVGVFDLVDGGVHAAVNVIDRVGGLERYLDGSFARIDGQTALYGHDDLDILARIDALAYAEAVESRQIRAGANICRNEQVQHAHALVASDALLSEPAIGIGDLKRFLIVVECVVSCRHYKRYEVVKAV